MEFADVISKSRVDDVTLRRNGSRSGGSIVITGHHLIFQPSEKSENSADSLLLLHKNVDLVQLDTKPQSGYGGSLTLHCKNFQIVVIEFSTAYEDCASVARSVEILSNLVDIKLHYPFFYHCSFRIYENGWDAFNLSEDEFTKLKGQSDFWRVSHVNKDFSVCPSYPQEVFVPKSISDDVLKCSAAFRDGGRFPVFCYYHKETRAVAVRCSQPLVGPGNKRCKEDEQLLNAMLNSSNRGYIIDTRSQNAANNAKMKGFGYEPEMHYPLWKRVHRATPRWQQLQESVAKLIEACNDSNSSTDKYLSKLNSSGWLQHVTDVLNCACVAAQCIDREEMSVVVHGSQGTDSTLMVVSLIQIILDPDCRTIKGFESLIEREWIKAGHPFSARCAHSAYGKSKNQSIPEAPSFLLFLDCVWQIYHQFVCSFEFTEQLLVFIFDHAYASEFGTFLCNNEREKMEHNVKTKTVSLWSYLNRPDMIQKYLNPFYDPNKNALWPSIAASSIELWTRMYCRWTIDWSTVDDEWSTLVALKQKETELQNKVLRLGRQVANMERESSKD